MMGCPNLTERGLRECLHTLSRVITDDIVRQPSRHFLLNLAKIPPNQVIADFGRGSSVYSESE